LSLGLEGNSTLNAPASDVNSCQMSGGRRPADWGVGFGAGGRPCPEADDAQAQSRTQRVKNCIREKRLFMLKCPPLM
jgi:hypothetical protein